MIYFIAALPRGPAEGWEWEDCPVKIGYSGSRQGCYERQATLQCGNPDQLVMLAIMPGSKEDEAWLHRAFAADRIRGEWFRKSRWLLQLLTTWAHTRAKYCQDAWTDEEFDAFMANPTSENECEIEFDHDKRMRDPDGCKDRMPHENGQPVYA